MFLFLGSKNGRLNIAQKRRTDVNAEEGRYEEAAAAEEEAEEGGGRRRRGRRRRKKKKMQEEEDGEGMSRI